MEEPKKIPVTADLSGEQVFDLTPFGGTLPGKCILTPDMEMLDCSDGHNNDDWAFDQIVEHYEANQ